MLANSKKHIRIISPSGRFDHDLLQARIEELEEKFQLSYHKLTADPSWPFLAGSFADRLEQLSSALLDPNVDIILSARGGYGASDLLPHLPWAQLKNTKPKLLVGFSDISALHSALYAQLDWPCLHAPMPGTELWDKGDGLDVACLKRLLLGSKEKVEIPLNKLSDGLPLTAEGWSYGGCLSVLTNLIGTSYFPKTLWGSVLFLEDIGEHPARIMRFINQWQQSGALRGVKAIVLGRFTACEVKDLCDESMLKREIARRLPTDVYETDLFGHCAPNWPLPVGLPVTIRDSHLVWNETLETR